MVRLISLALLCWTTLLAQAVEYRWIRELGGSAKDTVTNVGVDAAGNTYLAGSTTSPDFPVKNAWQSAPGSSGLLRLRPSAGSWAFDHSVNWTSVMSLSQDPRHPESVYAATSSGVLHTGDGGATWTPVAVPANVNQIAVDPSNSSILYAAVQEQGVMKSTDAGRSWTPAAKGLGLAYDGKPHAYSIVIDPHNPSLLFASTYTGLARSTDSGATWTETQAYNVRAAFDPFHPGVVYALNLGLTPLSRSTDNGVTFTPVGSPNPYLPLGQLYFDPLHDGTLYEGDQTGLFKSTDGGVTWKRKLEGAVLGFVADPGKPVLYAAIGYSLDATAQRVLMSSDGFDTFTAIGPPAGAFGGAVVVGDSVLVAAGVQPDVFVTKLDLNGQVVYSTYVGGAMSDVPSAMAVDSSGNVYVAGTSASLDFPVTKGAYRTDAPNRSGGSFLFRLNPDGALAWSTWLADTNTRPTGIALDRQGNPVLAGATSYGGLPTTPGVLQPLFMGIQYGGKFFVAPTNAFVTKFQSDGAGLVYSTYVGQQQATANAIALDAQGNVYLGGGEILYRVNRDATTLLASGRVVAANITAMAFDPQGSLYVTGGTNYNETLYTTPDAFQPAARSQGGLPGDYSVGSAPAFISRMLPDFTSVTASTLLGGEQGDMARGIAFDAEGNVIVAGTTRSQSFPTRTPAQGAFSSSTSFVSMLNPALSDLLVSTYAGDARPYSVAGMGVGPDGTVSFAGSTGTAPTGDPRWFDSSNPMHVIAAALRFGTVSGPRIDAVVNAASQLGTPLSPGGTFTVQGSGFGPDATIELDGTPVTVLSRSATAITAAVPAGLQTRFAGAVRVVVFSGRAPSDPVAMPLADAAPGIFPGWILNPDGTRNSPSNPVAEGSIITIQATGVGTATPVVPSVFIDGFYASGVDAAFGPVDGLPGEVYRVRVYVPHPADWVDRNPYLAGFNMPPQVAVRLEVNGHASQAGLALSVK